MTDPAEPKGPNPRLIVGFLSVMLAVQVFYAGVEILGGGWDTTRPLPLITGVAYFVYAALLGIFVVGVVRRMPWAWTLAVVIAGFGLVLTGLQVLDGDPIEGHVLGIFIDAGLLYYLLKPSIRAMFGH
jgi:hypothetical protein